MRSGAIFLLWCFLPATVLGQRPPAPALLGMAMVAGDRVTLADLLPVSASPSLRREAESVALGDAPVLGAARLFSRAVLTQRLEEEGMERSVSVQKDAIVTRKARLIHWTDVEPAVSKAFEARGVPLPSAGDLGLELAAPDGALEFRVRDLRYDARRKCYDVSMVGAFPSSRPFLVTVPEEKPILRPGAPRHVVTNQTVPDVRRGSRMVLQVQGKGFTATVPVVVLEDGARGTQIRVQDPQNRRIYRADLTSAGLVSNFN